MIATPTPKIAVSRGSPGGDHRPEGDHQDESGDDADQLRDLAGGLLLASVAAQAHPQPGLLTLVGGVLQGGGGGGGDVGLGTV
ncbi:hypothetical protein [Streptomyces sp. B1-3]|uniref:hypothetical protein n=1 Tax=Streptomyces sp. B1-3 TaxID=3141453 RepID=UPI003D2E8471